MNSSPDNQHFICEMKTKSVQNFRTFTVHSPTESFTILGLWVLGLVVSHNNGSNYKLMSPKHFFHIKFAIPLHPGTR